MVYERADRKRTTHMTDNLRQRIFDLREQGLSQGHIARELSVSQSNVGRVLKQLETSS